MSTKNIVESVFKYVFGTCIYKNRVVIGYFIDSHRTTITLSKKKYLKALKKAYKARPLLTSRQLHSDALLKPSNL